jgi:hypothetical protein
MKHEQIEVRVWGQFGRKLEGQLGEQLGGQLGTERWELRVELWGELDKWANNVGVRK